MRELRVREFCEEQEKERGIPFGREHICIRVLDKEKKGAKEG